ncbi:MAG: GNAT family N-acetyltransferase [Thermoplasmata archaeon]|nr:GNAT family N-acetyltransferase [Thermoplasmata archaeon]
MLRHLRRSDAAGFSGLLERHFPEENRLLGMRPAEFEHIVHRAFRWDFRLIVGLLRLFGRRIFELFVVEVDDHIAATAFVVYLPKAGYIGTVMVDDPYRRRGYAAKVVTACIENAGRAGRPYAILDVLTTNDPARRLYEKLGFRELQVGRFYVREMGPSDARFSAAPDGANIRAFHRRDAQELVRIAMGALRPDVAEVTPVEAGDFTSADFAAQVLLSETEAWVIGPPGRPRGFVRATASPAMAAANLTCPVLDPTVSEGDAQQLVERALGWVQARGAPRVVTEIKGAPPRAEATLRAAGFVPSIELRTLYRGTAG